MGVAGRRHAYNSAVFPVNGYGLNIIDELSDLLLLKCNLHYQLQPLIVLVPRKTMGSGTLTGWNISIAYYERLVGFKKILIPRGCKSCQIVRGVLILTYKCRKTT